MPTNPEKLQEMVSGEVCVNVIYRKDELDGGYIAECIELPGCMAQGETLDEVKVSIAEAVDDCLSVLLEECIKSQAHRGDTDYTRYEVHERLKIDTRHLRAAVV